MKRRRKKSQHIKPSLKTSIPNIIMPAKISFWNNLGNKKPALRQRQLLQKKTRSIFSFLSRRPIPRRNKLNVSFLGDSALHRKTPLTPCTLFKKESTKQRRLKPWGDADLDGSPNKFDCNPWNPAKDAKNISKNIISKVLIEGKDYNDVNIKESDFGTTNPADNQPLQVAAQTQTPIKSVKARGLTQEELQARRKKESVKLYLAQKRAMAQKWEQVASKVPVVGKHLKDVRGVRLLKIKEFQGAKKGALRSIRVEIKRRQNAGKKISKKMIEQEQKLAGEVSQAPLAKLKRVAKFKKELLGPGIYELATGDILEKDGLHYSKAAREQSRKIRRTTLAGVRALFGDAVTSSGGSGRPRGRPSGASGRYKIGGKTVYEQEFQDYKAKQNALNRLQASDVQSQTLTPQQIEQVQMQARIERLKQKQLPSPDVIQGGEMPTEAIAAAATETTPDEAVEQQMQQYTEQPQEEVQEQEPLPVDLKTAQMMAQEQDQILKAPQFAKGELKGTGGSLLTPSGPQILDAPNVFKGQMRTLNQAKDIPSVKLSERPQTNPYGDEYLEIDISSGKPRLMKRSREKWISGEAL